MPRMRVARWHIMLKKNRGGGELSRDGGEGEAVEVVFRRSRKAREPSM